MMGETGARGRAGETQRQRKDDEIVATRRVRTRANLRIQTPIPRRRRSLVVDDDDVAKRKRDADAANKPKTKTKTRDAEGIDDAIDRDRATPTETETETIATETVATETDRLDDRPNTNTIPYHTPSPSRPARKLTTECARTPIVVVVVAMTLEYPPDVLQTIASHIREDVLALNYDLIKPQRITFVSSVTFGGGKTLTSFLLSLALRAFGLAVLAACGLVAFVYVNRARVTARFDEWARERVMMELRKRTTATCALASARVRWNAVTLRGLTIGNAREEGSEVTFASPHLASFREIKIGIDFFSALGRLQMGNCVFGFVTTKCEEIYVSGASVYIEEVGKAKNFRIMRKKDKEAVVVEAAAPAEVEVAPADGFFGSMTSSLQATQKAIDAQIQEAMKLPGAVAGTLQNAGADVTKRLYALAEILEKLKRASPIDDEEEKHLDSTKLRRAPMVLRVNNLTFHDWSLSILSVASTPFQFNLFEKNNFIGRPGVLAKEIGIGLVTEIMNDFHRRMFSGITDGVLGAGSSILGAGTTIIGGVATAGSTIVGGVASGVTTAGSTIIGGVTSGVTRLAS